MIQKLAEFEIAGMRDFGQAHEALDQRGQDVPIAVYVELPGGGQRYFALAP